jgi:hypothetical protein
MASSRGLKITLGGFASAVGIFIALQPYFSLKDKVENHAREIVVLKTKFESDHDILLKVAVDVNRLKEDLAEIKGDVREIKRAINRNYGSYDLHATPTSKVN